MTVIHLYCDCDTDHGRERVHLGRARRMTRARAESVGYHWQLLGRYCRKTQLLGDKALSTEELLVADPSDTRLRAQFGLTCPRCKQAFRARAERLSAILDRFEAAGIAELALHTLDVAYRRYSGEVTV